MSGRVISTSDSKIEKNVKIAKVDHNGALPTIKEYNESPLLQKSSCSVLFSRQKVSLKNCVEKWPSSSIYLSWTQHSLCHRTNKLCRSKTRNYFIYYLNRNNVLVYSSPIIHCSLAHVKSRSLSSPIVHCSLARVKSHSLSSPLKHDVSSVEISSPTTSWPSPSLCLKGVRHRCLVIISTARREGPAGTGDDFLDDLLSTDASLDDGAVPDVIDSSINMTGHEVS